MTNTQQNSDFKTAVCISGQPRFFEKGFEYLEKNLLAPNNADVFIHCWYNPARNGVGFDSSKWASAGVSQAGSEEKIKELYKPVNSVFEAEKNPNPTNRRWVDFHKNRTQADPRILFSMFYSIMRANDIKREHEIHNDFKYDCVVRVRFDAALMDPIITKEYNQDTLNCLNIINNDAVICDWLNFGSSEIMDQYSDAYNRLEEYWDKDNIKLAGENLITHNVVKNNISINRHDIGLLLLREGSPSHKFGKTFNKKR